MVLGTFRLVNDMIYVLLKFVLNIDVRRGEGRVAKCDLPYFTPTYFGDRDDIKKVKKRWLMVYYR